MTNLPPPKCPKCKTNSQVWFNQTTGKLTCHRAYCQVEIFAPGVNPPVKVYLPPYEKSDAFSGESYTTTAAEYVEPTRYNPPIEDTNKMEDLDKQKLELEKQRITTDYAKWKAGFKLLLMFTLLGFCALLELSGIDAGKLWALPVLVLLLG